METTKCEHCGQITPIERTSWTQQFPNLSDRFEGNCVHCGERIVRVQYHCRKCNRYTLHRLSRFNHEKQTMIYVCDSCRTEKSIYIGLKKSPERSMMAV